MQTPALSRRLARRRFAGRAAPVALALTLAAGLVHAQGELPTGFGEFQIGEPWSDDRAGSMRELGDTALDWDRVVRECGYRSLVIPTDKGELLVTVNDNVITELSYVTPIKPDSDLLAVADLVMQTYGQPDRASMRDALGKVTIDKDRVNFVTLEYRSPRRVEFTVTGRELWQYRINVRFDQSRWHENKTMLCARERTREAREPAPAAGTAPPQ